MKDLMKGVLFGFSLLWSLNQTAWAEELTLGKGSLAGSGCAENSAEIKLDPAQRTLSILFDRYVVGAGKKSLDRKNCSVAIPVHVPKGLRLKIVGMNIQGVVALPHKKATVKLDAEVFFAGSVGAKQSKLWQGPLGVNYSLDSDIAIESACGADTILRINSSLLLKNGGKGQAVATVDSTSTHKVGLTYFLDTTECQN